MNISFQNNMLLLQIPLQNVDWEFVKKLQDYVRFLTIMNASQGSEIEAESLSESIKNAWWQANKSRFLYADNH